MSSLHHVHVSLHGTTTPTSATTPGLARMASGRVLLTVHNRCTSAATVVLEDAADADVLTFTSIPAGGSQTKGFNATAQVYQIEYSTTELLALTALGITRFPPVQNKAAVITTAAKKAGQATGQVGEAVTVTSPAGITDVAADHTEAYKWQRAASPFSSWADIADVANVQASASTNLAGATNNNLKFTAVAAGYLGNVASVTYVDPGGVTATLGVVVVANDITVNLGRAGSAVNSTGTLVKAAIAASAPATSLVTCANVTANDGTGLVAAMSKMTLAGGIDVNSSVSPTQYTVVTADVNDRVRLKTTATSSEGVLVSYSNASGTVVVYS